MNRQDVDVFISYSSKDKGRVEALVEILEGENIRVWWDRCERGNTEYKKNIEKKLNEATTVVVVWTLSSIESDWVMYEVNQVINDRNGGSKLIQICLDNIYDEVHKDQLTKLYDTQPELKGTSCYDFHNWHGVRNYPELNALIDQVLSNILKKRKSDKIEAVLAAQIFHTNEISPKPEERRQRIKVVRLHNEIVKAQIPENPHVAILKVVRDTVIVLFRGEDARKLCLSSAKRIQQAFNLYNLLFSAHRLDTKVSIAFRDPNDDFEFFPTRTDALAQDIWRKTAIQDYLGPAMDQASALLNLAQAGNILLSPEAEERLRRELHGDANRLLDDEQRVWIDPARFPFIRGLSNFSVGKLRWNRFPKRWDSMAELPFAKDAIAIIPFDKLNQYIRTREEQLDSCGMSGLGCKDLKLDFKHIKDILLIGQSLFEWSDKLFLKRRDLELRGIKVGAVCMSGIDNSALELTLENDKASKVREEIDNADENFRIVCEATELLEVRKAHTLLEQMWSFFSHSASSIFRAEKDEIFPPNTPILPYDAIAKTYLDNDNDKERFITVTNKLCDRYDKNLPVEWCINDVLLGAEPHEAFSMIFTLDWIQGICSPNDSTFLLARKRCQHIFDRCDSAPYCKRALP